MTLLNEELQIHWTNIAPLLTVHNEREHNAIEKRLNELLGEIGDNEKHLLYGLMDTLGTLLHMSEEKRYPIPDVSGAEAMRFLMNEHGLAQSDLPEVGS